MMSPVSGGFFLFLLALAAGGDASSPKATPLPLTPQFYQKNCMMCHKTAIPEGLDPAILEGVRPAHPTKSRDVMPNTTCWRRCEKCWRVSK